MFIGLSRKSPRITASPRREQANRGSCPRLRSPGSSTGRRRISSQGRGARCFPIRARGLPAFLKPIRETTGAAIRAATSRVGSGLRASGAWADFRRQARPGQLPLPVAALVQMNPCGGARVRARHARVFRPVKSPIGIPAVLLAAVVPFVTGCPDAGDPITRVSFAPSNAQQRPDDLMLQYNRAERDKSGEQADKPARRQGAVPDPKELNRPVPQLP